MGRGAWNAAELDGRAVTFEIDAAFRAEYTHSPYTEEMLVAPARGTTLRVVPT